MSKNKPYKMKLPKLMGEIKNVKFNKEDNTISLDFIPKIGVKYIDLDITIGKTTVGEFRDELLKKINKP